MEENTSDADLAEIGLIDMSLVLPPRDKIELATTTVNSPVDCKNSN
jgi:hypothetical protein